MPERWSAGHLPLCHLARRSSVQQGSRGGSGAGRCAAGGKAPSLRSQRVAEGRAGGAQVHKAQGGESRAVLMCLAPAHHPLLSRRLFYTGHPPSGWPVSMEHMLLQRIQLP